MDDDLDDFDDEPDNVQENIQPKHLEATIAAAPGKAGTTRPWWTPCCSGTETISTRTPL